MSDQFPGFTIPDGAYLPPELIYLLPNISGSELKILVVIVYHHTQLGGEEPTSLTDIENMTGLKRPTVSSALRSMMDLGYITRRLIGRSYVYEPVIQMVKKFNHSIVKKFNHQRHTESLRESDSKLIKSSFNSLSDSLNLTGDDGKKIELIKQLRAMGVYLKTAQDIVSKYPEEKIHEQIDYYKYALDKNMAQGPGWFVMSIKEDWQAPLGYQKARRNVGQSWLCQDCGQAPCECE